MENEPVRKLCSKQQHYGYYLKIWKHGTDYQPRKTKSLVEPIESVSHRIMEWSERQPETPNNIAP